MKIYREINIDLERYRKDISDKKIDYTRKEEERLICLYWRIESGEFKEAYEYVATWSREERELIPCEIWDVLMNVCMGIEYKIV